MEYREYAAKTPLASADAQPERAFKRRIRRLVCDKLLLPFALRWHRALLQNGQRVNDHTYTCFLRAPSQLKLLSGPILDHLGRPQRLDITLLACSNGAEPYTIASWLMQSVPELDFHIRASDLHPEMVAHAEAAVYTREEVLHSDYMTDRFLKATFEPHGEGYVVRPEVRARVSFSQASLLDGDGLRAAFGQAPLVIAQNVLFHLAPADANAAFANLVTLTAPGGVMMVEGMDLDLREEATARHRLTPFTQNLKKIHEETRVHTPARWWRFYWGTEPFMGTHPNAQRRYATAFKRSG